MLGGKARESCTFRPVPGEHEQEPGISCLGHRTDENVVRLLGDEP